MRNIIITLLLVCFIFSLSSCAETDAGIPVVYDLSSEVKITKAEKDSVSIDGVRDVIKKAMEICEKNDAVRIDADTVLRKKDVSYMDADYVKALTPENFSEDFKVYREQLANVKTVAVELLEDYFPEESVFILKDSYKFNSNPPSHIFFIQRSDDPAKEIKVTVDGGDIYYHDGEAEPELLYPTLELAEVEGYFWELNRKT